LVAIACTGPSAALQPAPTSAPVAPPAPASAPAPAPVPGERPAPAKLDIASFLAPIKADHDVPAMWAAVVTSRGIESLGCVGIRQRGDATPAEAGDLLHLGSCAKSMTATLVAALVEKGVLRWETTLAEALPELKDSMHEAYRGVTLAQLCTHRGGVPADLREGGLWLKLMTFEGTPEQARRTLAEGVLTKPPASTPGTKEEYSNAGFALAGHVCERVTGKPFEALIQDTLFAPLGITTAGFGAPGSAERVDQPRGHTAAMVVVVPGSKGSPADNPSAITPAGRIHMSLEDWGRYIALHLRGARGGREQLGPINLGPEVFGRLHRPPTGEATGYSYGWVRLTRPWAGPEGDRTVLFHNGSNTMWFAVAWLAPARDLAVLVVTNQGGQAAERACDRAAGMLIRRMTE
jgi:CubicO group peptidase (beta-lactamase class C family)